MRNDMVFNIKAFDLRQLLDNIKLKIVSWFKTKWPSCDVSLIDVVKFPNLIKASLGVKSVRAIKLWKAPPFDSMKFNVDGSSKGKHGLASIDGVLRTIWLWLKLFSPKQSKWWILLLQNC